MALRDYLAEEIAFDFADARLSRREALKRLALLGSSFTTPWLQGDAPPSRRR
jgi:hypothetical protein